MSGQSYDRLRTVSLEKTLEAIGEQVKIIKNNKQFHLLQNGSKAKRHLLEGIEVHLTSLRLLTFYEKGTECSCCGLKAEYFAFERNAGRKGKPSQGSYHLNLWGRDKEGEEVLFTHDHTLARSLGGIDDSTNTTTMCVRCNGDKAKIEYILKMQLRQKESELV